MPNKIRVDKFCSLANSPSWQAWLYHYDAILFAKFVKKIRESRGCSQNTDVMIDTLKEIDQSKDGSEKLLDFISKNYPYMIVEESQSSVLASDDIFGYFNPSILTYPHRLIFNGSKDELIDKAREFSKDKLKIDYVIINNKLYIEYLNNDEESLINQIPANNWKISIWRTYNT